LAACEGKLRHLGVNQPPKRSTLSYANEHRPWELYRSVFYDLLEHCRGEAAGHKRKFRFKHKLLSIDSTTIALSLSMFDWAQYKRSKGAVKLHLVLDHDGYLPQYGVISDGKEADISAAKKMSFMPGTMLVFDRGYADYDWWLSLGQQKVFFVSRLKDKADYEVMEERTVPEKGNVLKDEVIVLFKLAAEDKECFLRRIEVWVEEKQETMVFVTNNLKLAASTIAAIYKERWAIELFFENSTWCTPSYVYGISRASCFESAVVGVAVRFRSAIQRSTSALRMTQGELAQACVAGNRFNRISRKTVVCVTPRTLHASPTNISLRACRSPSRWTGIP
jgi:hypothetical protein